MNPFFRLDCKTTSGKKVGEKCVFPFKYKGRTCPGPMCCSFEGEAWCSTKVDGDGVHVPGNWGYCKETGCQPKGEHPFFPNKLFFGQRSYFSKKHHFIF